MIPDRITAKWLREHGATCEQVEIVEREWPDGARPLAATARKAVRLGLRDFTWLADHLLPESAWAEYDRAEALARAEFERAEAAELEEFERLTRTATWAERKRGMTEAARDAAVAPALAKRKQAEALALLDAWRGALRLNKERGTTNSSGCQTPEGTP